MARKDKKKIKKKEKRKRKVFSCDCFITGMDMTYGHDFGQSGKLHIDKITISFSPVKDPVASEAFELVLPGKISNDQPYSPRVARLLIKV